MATSDVKKGGNVPEEDHIARLIRFKSLVREGDQVVGIFPQAFKLRDIDDYLSVTWIEYFGAYDDASRKAAAHAIQEDTEKKKLGKAHLAIGVVQDVKEAGRLHGQALRVTYEPNDRNKGHSALRRLDDENLELLEMLASESFANVFACAGLLAP